jgi:hypothetical protein
MLAIVASGCGLTKTVEASGEDAGNPTADSGGSGNGEPTPEDTPAIERFDVTLVPEPGITGMQRVNFAIPFARGQLAFASTIRILAGTVELPAARQPLARHADGSLRSVQVQVDIDVAATPTLTIELGAPGADGPTLVPVTSTLTGTGNNVRPRVWVLLPSTVLAASEVAGPIATAASVAGTTLDAWDKLCDYDRWDTAAFLVNASSSRDVWLFDRVTAMYRGYAITGRLSPLRSAYREAEIYRAGMTISNGVATGIAVPNASTDLKYYYSQGMALHYLLTGDERFREAAEAVSARVVTMWNPNYDGGDRFWTERHAGFALLAHEWAALVTDDKADVIEARAEAAVTAFLNVQNTYPASYTDPNARCFAHRASAHGESYGNIGCSPWMSAILADALDAHARRVGGTRATVVRTSLAQLGRIIARDGRDSSGRPYYWMAVGSTGHQTDSYNEHWGEAAYLTALAWDATGKTEPALEAATTSLINGLRTRGVAGHVRSFNWQCRSAVMAPAFVQ